MTGSRAGGARETGDCSNHRNCRNRRLLLLRRNWRPPWFGNSRIQLCRWGFWEPVRRLGARNRCDWEPDRPGRSSVALGSEEFEVMWRCGAERMAGRDAGWRPLGQSEGWWLSSCRLADWLKTGRHGTLMSHSLLRCDPAKSCNAFPRFLYKTLPVIGPEKLQVGGE